MKIVIPSREGEALKTKILQSAEDQILRTWIVKKNMNGEKVLTYKPDQWYNMAFLKFTVGVDHLEISVTCPESEQPNDDVKGYYIGRFVEILLVHFQDHYRTFTVIP